jgi:hypothetical protein
VVLTTESKEKYEALLASYREKYDPDGPMENALVDQLAAADWQQRRVTAMITALVDVTMDRMEKEISKEFENIDNATRTALAFASQADQSGALALLNRYAARHARDIHRALSDLRKVQADRRNSAGAPVSDDPAATEQKIQNEPNEPPAAEKETPTGHWPLTTAFCKTNPTNRQPPTRHSPLN